MVAPRPLERYVQVLTLGMHEGALFGKRVFANLMKNVMMRSSWI